MKNLFILLALLMGYCYSFAQDKIVLKDGTELNVKVIESNSKCVIFTYPNEEVRNEKSKSVIDYILYASGRREEGIKIPTIESEKDWEKVILTTDKNDVEGLTKVKYIKVSGGSIWVKSETAHKSAEEKLKKKAAKQKCGIVLVTLDKYTGDHNQFCDMGGDCYK